MMSSSSAAFVFAITFMLLAFCMASAFFFAAKRAFDSFAIWMRAMPAGSCAALPAHR
jgi:uncharacterized membrane protein (DUF485 family)